MTTSIALTAGSEASVSQQGQTAYTGISEHICNGVRLGSEVTARSNLTASIALIARLKASVSQ